ncbi:hypothetical protein IFR05_002758 [Cadophora sp. M221]|nr:hypothetical protein IFR05_002758 [Cadophora sp. M221]
MATNYVPASGALVSNSGISAPSPLDRLTPNLDNANSTFHPFPRLPLELRNMIWLYDIFYPDILKVRVHRYRCNDPSGDHDCDCQQPLLGIYFTTEAPPCALLSATNEAWKIARNYVWARLQTDVPRSYIQYNPDVTTVYITNLQELLDSVAFDDAHPDELVDWICPSTLMGDDIVHLAIDLRQIYYTIRDHPQGVWHELVWGSLLRKMFSELETIEIVTDPKNTGFVFSDACLTIHEGDDEDTYETEDEDENDAPYSNQASLISSFFDEEELNPRIFGGNYLLDGWHENVDAIQSLATDFMHNVTEAVYELEPKDYRCISVRHFEGRDKDGELILKYVGGSVKEERSPFESCRIFAKDYGDESDVGLAESGEDGGNRD